MADYSKMYYRLFNAQTDAITILQNAQKDAEEMYIASPEPEVRVLRAKEPDENEPEKE